VRPQSSPQADLPSIEFPDIWSVGGEFLDGQGLPKLPMSLRHFPSLHQKKTSFINSMTDAFHSVDKSASRLRRTAQNGKKIGVKVALQDLILHLEEISQEVGG
jgi:hypothetical protein